ncbi:beta-propeller fold lactonase family protein [Bacillus cereus]|uniref:BslA/BslB family hydrophobin n=1 Tax=Bacillus cereus TaxID=1396 RepID=UPI0022815F1D|nr:beta-propeller fold lactonase family protein [Bacillus cereus]
MNYTDFLPSLSPELTVTVVNGAIEGIISDVLIIYQPNGTLVNGYLEFSLPAGFSVTKNDTFNGIPIDPSQVGNFERLVKIPLTNESSTFELKLKNKKLPPEQTYQFSAENTFKGGAQLRAEANLSIHKGVLAYITNSGSDSISVIDTSTNIVVDTISDIKNPSALAITPNNGFIYVGGLEKIVNGGEVEDFEIIEDLQNPVSRVSYVSYVINSASKSVVKTIPLPDSPSNGYTIAITPNGDAVHFATLNRGISGVRLPTAEFDSRTGEYRSSRMSKPNTVFIINPITNTIEDTKFSITDDTYLDYIISPDGKYSYTALKFETGTSSSILPIPINSVPMGYQFITYPKFTMIVAMCISPNGDFLYAFDKNGVIYVVDLSNREIIKEIPIEGWGKAIVVTPNGEFIYAASSDKNLVSVINSQTYAVEQTISVGNSPVDIAFTPNGEHAYVVNSGSNNISVINTTTYTVEQTIPVENSPVGIAIYK